jgi:hypothetical protein
VEVELAEVVMRGMHEDGPPVGINVWRETECGFARWVVLG